MQLLSLTQLLGGRAVLISGCTDHKPAASCAACVWNANAALPLLSATAMELTCWRDQTMIMDGEGEFLLSL